MRFAREVLRCKKALTRKGGETLRPGDAPGFGPWLTPSPSRLAYAGDAMDARKVAAHFAAFVWFSNRSPRTREEAVRFADDAWPAFLPLAHEGLGRLLIKIATPQVAPARRRRLRLSQTPRRKPAVARARGGERRGRHTAAREEEPCPPALVGRSNLRRPGSEDGQPVPGHGAGPETVGPSAVGRPCHVPHR
jgi:hypothetical protein